VRQKLQEQSGLTPQSMQSDQSANVDDTKPDGISSLLDKTTKINKCCVSFKLSSPGSACSCKSVLAEGGMNVHAVSDAGSDVSEKNDFVANVADVQDGNLVTSEGLQSESRSDMAWEYPSCKPDEIKPDCNQSDTSCNVLACSVSDEHIAAIEYCVTDQQKDDHLCFDEESTQHRVVAASENVCRRCTSGLQASQVSDIQEQSSLIANSVNALQNLQSSSVENTSAPPVSSSGCDLNFSSMDEDIFACFTDGDNFVCDLYSSQVEVCKKDISETVSRSIESDHNSTPATENVENQESFMSDDAAASLCHTLSVVKLAVAETINSEVSDFVLPDSQYGEIIRMKIKSEGSRVDKEMVERTAHSSISGLSLSQSQQSSAGRLSHHQRQKNQQSVCCSMLSFTYCFSVML